MAAAPLTSLAQDRATPLACQAIAETGSLEMAFRMAGAFGVPIDEVFQYPDVE